MVEKPPRFTRNKDAKIQQILHATHHLIEQHGYYNVTVNQIADEAHVSVGLIYKHFEHGVIDIIVELEKAVIQKTVSTDFVKYMDKKNYQEYARMILQELYRQHKIERNFFIAMQNAFLIREDLLGHFDELSTQATDILKEFVNHLTNLGLPIRSCSLEDISFIMQFIDSSIHYQVIFRKDNDETKFIENLLEFCIKFLNLPWNESIEVKKKTDPKTEPKSKK